MDFRGVSCIVDLPQNLSNDGPAYASNEPE